jgi:hypothetical protein
MAMAAPSLGLLQAQLPLLWGLEVAVGDGGELDSGLEAAAASRHMSCF